MDVQSNDVSAMEVPEEKKKMPCIEDFNFLKPISRGAFGKVFLGCKYENPGQLYAIKVVKKSDIIHKNMVEQIITERNALALTKSPFCVQLFYSLQTVSNVFLVMEYLIGGDLKSLLTMYGYFDELMAVFYVAELSMALVYLHKHGIIHRDVKPDNMLLDDRGHLKLTDFGLSKITFNKDMAISDLAAVTPSLTSSGPKYLRTPGQILSLASHLSFNSEDGSELMDGSLKQTGKMFCRQPTVLEAPPTVGSPAGPDTKKRRKSILMTSKSCTDFGGSPVLHGVIPKKHQLKFNFESCSIIEEKPTKTVLFRSLSFGEESKNEFSMDFDSCTESKQDFDSQIINSSKFSKSSCCRAGDGTDQAETVSMDDTMPLADSQPTNIAENCPSRVNSLKDLADRMSPVAGVPQILKRPFQSHVLDDFATSSPVPCEGIMGSSPKSAKIVGLILNELSGGSALDRRGVKRPRQPSSPKVSSQSAAVRSGLTASLKCISIDGTSAKGLRKPLQEIRNVSCVETVETPKRTGSFSNPKCLRVEDTSFNIECDDTLIDNVFSPSEPAKSLDNTKLLRWYSESDAHQKTNPVNQLSSKEDCPVAATDQSNATHVFSSFHTPARLTNVLNTPLQCPTGQTPFRRPKSVRRCPIPTEESRILGTPDYLAPELLLKLGHGTSVDWWAVGVCLYEFMTGIPPFNDETPQAVFNNILKRDIPLPEGEEALSATAIECIDSLLSIDPIKRANFDSLKTFELFKVIDWSNIHHSAAPFVPEPDNAEDTIYFAARNNVQQLTVSNFDL